MTKKKPQPDFDTCPTCGKTKPTAEFGRDRRRAEHCTDECIACQEVCRTRRVAHKRERFREMRANCRQQVLAHYGGVCACCGRDWDLTVDHVHGRYSGDYSDSGDLYVWLVVHGLPMGFQILCGRCNSSKNISGECRFDHKPLAENADPSELLDMQDAAAEAGIAYGTLINHVRKGTWPPPDDISGRFRRWRRDTVRAEMARLQAAWRRGRQQAV